MIEMIKTLINTIGEKKFLELIIWTEKNDGLIKIASLRDPFDKDLNDSHVETTL